MESRPVRPTRRSRLSSCEVTRSLSSSTTCRELMSGKSSMNNSDDVSSDCLIVIPCLRKASVTHSAPYRRANLPHTVQLEQRGKFCGDLVGSEWCFHFAHHIEHRALAIEVGDSHGHRVGCATARIKMADIADT